MARRKHGSRFNKTFKAFGILGAVFALIASLGLAGIMVFDLIFPNAMISQTPRSYLVQFENDGSLISSDSYVRGAKIKFPTEKPTRAPDEDDDYYYSYTFKGWDITNDNFSDWIPHYAFYSFRARAVYNKKSVAKPKPSSSKPEPSSQDSSGSGSSSGTPWWWPKGGN